jgi:hypothetical protein
MLVQERRNRTRAATVARRYACMRQPDANIYGAPAAAQTTDTGGMTRRYAFTNMVSQ